MTVSTPLFREKPHWLIFDVTNGYVKPEAALQSCSLKMMYLKILLNSQDKKATVSESRFEKKQCVAG